jgi:hypothetical protein
MPHACQVPFRLSSRPGASCIVLLSRITCVPSLRSRYALPRRRTKRILTAPHDGAVNGKRLRYSRFSQSSSARPQPSVYEEDNDDDNGDSRSRRRVDARGAGERGRWVATDRRGPGECMGAGQLLWG